MSFLKSQKIKLSHKYGYSKINKKICKENLKILHAVFNKYKIFFWLSEGTALGFTRENNIITNDDDVDISLFIKDKNKLLKALKELKKYNFIVTLILNKGNFIRLGRKNEIIDIDIVEKNKYCIACFCNCNKLIPYLKKFNKTIINGLEYNIPTKDYIKFLYGNDWHIPKKYKPSSINCDWKLLI